MFTLEEAAEICGGRLKASFPGARITGVTIDSRAAGPGDLFAAFKGARTDGHEFAADAAGRGAAAALVSREVQGVSSTILVSDVLRAVERLAQAWRKRFSIPVVAVTGSSGKTTTKECISALLSQVFRVRTSFRNWNNHIGIPLNILRLQEPDQCLILELGANHAGEIVSLCRIAEPTVGVITGIHAAHLEGFESIDGVYRAKLELADFISSRRGTMIANGDDPKLIRLIRERTSRLLTFGTSRRCDFFLSRLAARNGFVCFRVNDAIDFRLRGHGTFNAMNALAAIAAAAHFRLDLRALSESWLSLPLPEGRFTVTFFERGNWIVVDDSYNSNPVAFHESLTSFAEIAGERRKVVVAGDMLELGKYSTIYHEAMGQLLADFGVDLLIGVGAHVSHAVRWFRRSRPSGEAYHAADSKEGGLLVTEHLKEGDAVFIKGSHGVRLEEIRRVFDSLSEIESPTLSSSAL